MTKPMSPEEMQAAFVTIGQGIAKLGEHVVIALKSQPSVPDVHVSTSGKASKAPKPIMFDQLDDENESDEEDDDRPLPDGQLDKVYAFDLPFRITKIDSDQRRVWGWASISQLGDQVIIDKQGDIIPIAELEKAVYDYVLHSRRQGDMHTKLDVGDSIESMVFTPEKEAAGIVAKDANGKSIYGWWVGFEINDADVWKDYKAGRRPEFSIGGKSGWTERP